MRELEGRVFLIPVRVLNSESLGSMGVRVWDWQYLVIQAARKIDAVSSAIRRTRDEPYMELPEKVRITESNLDECPYATPQGVII